MEEEEDLEDRSSRNIKS